MEQQRRRHRRRHGQQQEQQEDEESVVPYEIRCDDSTLPSLVNDPLVSAQAEDIAWQNQQSSNSKGNNGSSSPLFGLLLNHDWDVAVEWLRRHPETASEWQYGIELDRWDTFEPRLWKRLPLHQACRFGAPLRVVQALVRSHPPSATERDPYSKALPIHLACRYRCSTKVVSFLINAKPDGPKQADTAGRLPLHYACWTAVSSTIVFRLVQAYPLSVCVVDLAGKTPLEYTTVNTGIESDTLALMDKLSRFFLQRIGQAPQQGQQAQGQGQGQGQQAQSTLTTAAPASLLSKQDTTLCPPEVNHRVVVHPAQEPEECDQLQKQQETPQPETPQQEAQQEPQPETPQPETPQPEGAKQTATPERVQVQPLQIVVAEEQQQQPQRRRSSLLESLEQTQRTSSRSIIVATVVEVQRAAQSDEEPEELLRQAQTEDNVTEKAQCSEANEMEQQQEQPTQECTPEKQPEHQEGAATTLESVPTVCAPTVGAPQIALPRNDSQPELHQDVDTLHQKDTHPTETPSDEILATKCTKEAETDQLVGNEPAAATEQEEFLPEGQLGRDEESQQVITLETQPPPSEETETERVVLPSPSPESDSSPPQIQSEPLEPMEEKLQQSPDKAPSLAVLETTSKERQEADLSPNPATVSTADALEEPSPPPREMDGEASEVVMQEADSQEHDSLFQPPTEEQSQQVTPPDEPPSQPVLEATLEKGQQDHPTPCTGSTPEVLQHDDEGDNHHPRETEVPLPEEAKVVTTPALDSQLAMEPVENTVLVPESDSQRDSPPADGFDKLNQEEEEETTQPEVEDTTSMESPAVQNPVEQHPVVRGQPAKTESTPTAAVVPSPLPEPETKQEHLQEEPRIVVADSKAEAFKAEAAPHEPEPLQRTQSQILVTVSVERM